MAKAAGHKVGLQYVSPDLLDFDPSNPRFAGLLKGRTQEEIQKEIYDEPYYASALVDSLLENGFIDYEPLVVKRRGDRYIVVEGNRRLAAIKEIRSNLDRYEGRKSDLERIPVLVFPIFLTSRTRNSKMRCAFISEFAICWAFASGLR